MSDSQIIIDNFVSLVKSFIKRPGMYAINRVEDMEFIFFGYQAGVVSSIGKNEFSDFLHSFKLYVGSPGLV